MNISAFSALSPAAFNFTTAGNPNNLSAGGHPEPFPLIISARPHNIGVGCLH